MGLAEIVRKSIVALGISALVALPSPAMGDQPPQLPPQLAGNIRIRPEARAIVYGVNVLGNGLVCGVAAAIKERNILVDTLKCMAAGSLQYAGMEAGMYDVPALPGFALRLVETGTSMGDNTLAGRDLFERLHYGFGPLLFQIDTTGQETSMYWRILPAAGIIANLARNNEFSPGDTLSYQAVTFTAPPTLDGGIGGDTIGNVMLYHRTIQDEVSPRAASNRAHEFAHVLQYVRLRPVQHAVPRVLQFLEDDLKLRIGEDMAIMLLEAPGRICRLADGDKCGRHWYDLTEVEAYAMQTAAE